MQAVSVLATARRGAAAAAVLAILLAGVQAAAAAAPPAGHPRAPELVIEAPESLSAAAARLAALDRRRLWTAVELAGLDDPGPPIRVVLAPEDSPQARAVHSWVAGYARGAGGPIVIFPARTPTYPDESLEELVHHEVAHVMIARAARGNPVPRWFNEGTAMAAGRAWGVEDASRSVLAALRGGPVRLAEADRMFDGGGAAAARAYAVSGSFVRELRSRHGPDVTAEILRRVGRGVAFEHAFRQATGEPLAAAEERFWRRRTFWQRWLPFLTSSFALWLAVTLLALWAFRRRRQRDAELAERWAEEERARAAALSGGTVPGEGGGSAGRGSGSPWVN